jgi:hypothetical protein
MMVAVKARTDRRGDACRATSGLLDTSAAAGHPLSTRHRTADEEYPVFTSLRRIVSLVLLAWFAFLVASLVGAVRRKTELGTTAPPAPDSNDVELVAVFEELDFRSTARALRNVRVETRFGGGLLDLRGATLDPSGATVDIEAIFGGGQLVIPDDWNVTTAISGIGGIGDGRDATDRAPDAPHLAITGRTLLGGWGITSDLPHRAQRQEAEQPTATA